MIAVMVVELILTYCSLLENMHETVLPGVRMF